ncbi:cytochrome-c oxidase, cbb3-type subunit II [Cocleimonas flava]|jgi:cytochrome c oxidase cbb3-type subunit 2|uniref:Cytochrome c oxidase cbb3-type subunit 2 n=1 Tax=Cocleimonas flava TaxID=634765 RepID=A0A4R1F386_9GAMM|nr:MULTISPECIES: cytochrome-c oxidase, cbb3-type subunit II [Cocleimonas]MEB8432133.1 cytochrome-c oxidase, cbb3-type subunit II [Cocleimonas sp. KMM 6892]MEC4714781.1 cytochrome-c oxidase, cbb3-type subunit II [Cocleimonas sp. KMM 6895]MEC4744405.1 cytochrome-c oxidase, cbb3-type subunit II [Cocleimonas sp. KMM 6896]TCJ87004.1 cytochrome c oxidase cbb3-type subunit 2 [Cocleimonas flava]
MMKHESIETNAALLIVLTLAAISIGGLVEIVPLFYIEGTVEDVKNEDGKDAVRPYTPLEQLGRDIYTREGCYTCHSQMIRPFRDEALRYGHYSLAAESQYDHPFQWGSKRTGPDLARVGGKYSSAWHTKHLMAPRSVVPESIMPNYPWLTDKLDYTDVQGKMRALKAVGVPYSLSKIEFEANVEKFGEEVAKKLDINAAEVNLKAQAKLGNYDGDPENLTEMDALVAYLQILGTMIDFSKHDEAEFVKFR